MGTQLQMKVSGKIVNIDIDMDNFPLPACIIAGWV